jgi:hypothetical protein
MFGKKRTEEERLNMKKGWEKRIKNGFIPHNKKSFSQEIINQVIELKNNKKQWKEIRDILKLSKHELNLIRNIGKC